MKGPEKEVAPWRNPSECAGLAPDRTVFCWESKKLSPEYKSFTHLF